MPAPTLTPGNDQQDKERNIAQQKSDDLVNRLSRAEQRPSDVDQQPGSANMDEFENKMNEPSYSGPDDPTRRLSDRESNSGAPAPWTDNTRLSDKEMKSRERKKVQGWLRKSAPALGIGGVLTALILAFMALMPLKAMALVENITSIASEIPGYAVERRTEYITTKLLATHLLKKASGLSVSDADVAAKAVFCKGASISCSLLATYGSDYFDKIIDVSVKERFGDKVTMTLAPKGVTSLGGSARSWELKIDRDLGDGQILNTVKELNSNAEAKAYVKKLVNNNLKTKNIATRYLARAILMKKYGITHWRAFEKTSNKVDETKSKLKSSILKNTVGKVSGKMSLYLGCFSNADVCEKLKDGFNNQAGSVKEKLDDLEKRKNSLSPEEYQKQKKKLDAQFESLNKLAGNTPLSEEELAGGAAKQVIIKRLLAVAGVAGVIGTVDMIFSAVSAVDNGALEQVSADMAKVAYVGFAFGDEAGVVPNVEKIKAGDGDLSVLGDITGMFDGAEQSPLMQYETGLIPDANVASNSYTRTCNVDDEQKAIPLQQGQLVCPERSVGRDYTSLLVSNPAWQALATTATVWNESIGKVVDMIGTFVGNIPILQWISEQVSALAKPMIEWAISLFFVPPDVGPSTTGVNNYDALSGGIRISQNETMEEGVSDTGEAYGGGGSVLQPVQVSAITDEVRKSKQDSLNEQPIVARIFNLNLEGSFAQQMVLRMPTSLGSIATTPLSILSGALRGDSSAGAASATAVNPFNMPIYGYAVNDPVLSNDPSLYTEDYCSASAQKRKDSYKRDLSRSTLPSYGVSDPCALEKMVVGSMLQAQGVTDDKYSLKNPSDQSSGNKIAGAGKYVFPVDLGYSAPDDDQLWGPRNICNSGDSNSFCKFHRGFDFAFGGQGQPVYSIADGEVIETAFGNPACSQTESGQISMDNRILIRHSDGTTSGYSHMTIASAQAEGIKVGTKVTAGQKIGAIGNCGNVQGAHLHFTINPGSATDPKILAINSNTRGETFIDPAAYMLLYGVDIKAGRYTDGR